MDHFIDDIASVSDFERVCRLCLSRSNLNSIFELGLSNEILKCFEIVVIRGDGFPDKICQRCCEFIEMVVGIRKICKASQERLKNAIKQKNVVKTNTSDAQFKFELSNDVLDDIKADDIVNGDGLYTNCSTRAGGDEVNTLKSAKNRLHLKGVEKTNDYETNDGCEVVKRIPLKCYGCEKVFYDGYTRIQHEKKACQLMGPKNFYQCRKCPELLKFRRDLKKHLKIHELSKSKRKSKLAMNTILLDSQRLSEVKAKSAEIYEKLESIEIVTEELNVDRSVGGSSERSVESSSFEETTKPLYKSTMPTECPICMKMVRFRQLECHMGAKHPTGPLVACPDCGKMVKYLPGHQKLHRFRLLRCEEAGCRYSTRLGTSLLLHQRTHRGEKPFVCELCGHRSLSKSNLKVHQLVHSGYRQYECSDCHKKYKYKRTLTQHISFFHLGLRPFCCQKCGNTYAHRKGLRNHLRKKHTSD